MPKDNDDIEFESDDDDEEAIETQLDGGKIIWHGQNLSIYELRRQSQKGNLDVQPFFQRHYVWSAKKASRLIESVFLDVPLPLIYLAEEKDGIYSVIDGQQRLTSFFMFLDSKLQLNSLEVKTDLLGKTFNQLDGKMQSTFENKTLPIIIINKESDENIKFTIFERLNTGAQPLTDQELRNCIFRGNYNNLLKDCASDEDFRFMLGLTEEHKRMIDQELVLRFFAFYKNTYLNYKPPTKQFLNNEMSARRNIDERDYKKLKEVFKKSISLCRTVFGKNAFHRFIRGSDNKHDGYWEKRLNKGLFDILMFGFTRYDKNQIMRCSDTLREEILWQFTSNKEFIESISGSSTDRTIKVIQKFEIWLKALQGIVGYPQTEPRAFRYQIKQELFEANPICARCDNKIHDIDDSHVDHVEFYWRGGKTIPENARLTHRYCNWSRGGRD